MEVEMGFGDEHEEFDEQHPAYDSETGECEACHGTGWDPPVNCFTDDEVEYTPNGPCPHCPEGKEREALERENAENIRAEEESLRVRISGFGSG